MRKLLLEALQGNPAAWRKMGVRFWKVRFCRKNRELAKLCLKKAMEDGDEEAYFFYCTKVDAEYAGVDQECYREMLKEYRECQEPEKKRKLKKYLELAVDRRKKQKQSFKSL